jgi:putative transposase
VSIDLLDRLFVRAVGRRAELDCCDREAIAWVATTGGISGGDIRDLMVESVERRYGLVNRLPVAIE